MQNEIEQAIELLDSIANDKNVPKNVRTASEQAQIILKNTKMDIEVKRDTVSQILDEITNDPNVETFTRTQIWAIVSALESGDA